MRRFFTLVIFFAIALPASAARDGLDSARQAFQTLGLMASLNPDSATVLSESLKAQLLPMAFAIGKFHQSGHASQELLNLGRDNLSEKDVQFLRSHYDNFLRHWAQSDSLFAQAFIDYHATWMERTRSGLRRGLIKTSVVLLEIVAMIATLGHYHPTGWEEDARMKNARKEAEVAVGLRALLDELYPDCEQPLRSR